MISNILHFFPKLSQANVKARISIGSQITTLLPKLKCWNNIKGIVFEYFGNNKVVIGRVNLEI